MIKLFLHKFFTLHQKGFFYTLIVMVFGQGLSFLQKILVGRWLSVENFARFSLIVETIMLMATLLTLGLPVAMMRFGLQEQRLKEYFAGTIRIFCYLSCIFYLGYFLGTFFYPLFKDSTINYWINITIIFSFPFAFLNYVTSYLAASKKIKERSWLRLLQRTFYFLCIVIGCYLLQWHGVIIGLTSFSFLFLIYLIIKYRNIIFSRIKAFPYKKILNFSLWDSSGSIGLVFTNYIILLFSERYLKEITVVSQLCMAFSFTVIAKIFFASFNDLLFPYFTEKKSRQKFSYFLFQVFIMQIILAGLILIIAYGIIPYLINYFLGARYDQSINLFHYLVWGEIIIGFALMLEMINQIWGFIHYRAISLNLLLLVIFLIAPFLLKNYGVTASIGLFLFFAVVRFLIAGSGVIYGIFIKKILS